MPIEFPFASVIDRIIGESNSDRFQSEFDRNFVDVDPLEFIDPLGYHFTFDDDEF